MLTIYKASAGSGKTFTLAFEYIKILLGIRLNNGSYVLNDAACTPSHQRTPDRHRSILAITFTNAATEEMKNRIIGELNKLSTLADFAYDTDTPYARMLIQAYGCTRPALRRAAALALNELINDYNYFNVSTIDSFFQMVLRTFSREIDHQGDYELSMDRGLAIRQSISGMLDELNYHALPASKRLYAWIKEYMLDKINQGSDYNFFNRNGAILSGIASRMDDLLDEIYVQNASGIRDFARNEDKVRKFIDALRTLIEQQNNKITRAAEGMAEACDSCGISFADCGAYSTRFEQLSKRPPEVNDKTFDQKAVTALITQGDPLKDIISKTKAKKLGLTPQQCQALDEAAQSLFETAWNASRRTDILRRIINSVGELEFIVLAESQMEDFLREANTMLISDSGELLSRIISDAEMPFIYERLGMQIENLLIDEFQDTSRLQWHNLKPLVANSLAADNDNLIIGDVKQAIYRFRNSDSSLLDYVVPNQDFPVHIARGNLPEDNTNRRSAPEVVMFNNTIFKLLAINNNLSSYNTVVQGLNPVFARKNIGGCVGMTIFHKKTPPPEFIYSLLANKMRAQHDAGYRWSDILILVRERKQGAAIISYFLDHYPDIPILSNESLLLRNSPAVRTVMSMLALVEKIYAEGPVKAEANKPYYGTHDDVVDFDNRYHLFLNQGMAAQDALAAALDREADPGELRRQVLAIRGENPAGVVALIEGIINHKLSQKQRDGQQPYLAALQDRAIEHSNSSDPSIAAFVDAYNRNINKWAIMASADINSAEVMTIHKSKGLERDCVHIPFADWELAKANDIWLSMDKFTCVNPDICPPLVRIKLGMKDPLLDPQIAPEFAAYAGADRRADIIDGINNSYVAFTRAARELNIYAGVKNFGAMLKDIVETSLSPTPGTVDLPSLTSQCFIDSTGQIYNTMPEGDQDQPQPVFEVLHTQLGSPTAPAKPHAAVDSEPAPPYTVVRRSDMRELISIDDVFSDSCPTGDEYEPEITDAPDGSEAMRRAAERGLDYHAILSTINTIDDIDSAVAAYVNRGFLRPSEADDCCRELKEAFAEAPDPVNAWFDPRCEVYAERSIYDPASGRTYRPDRVVRMPDGTFVVIDFKFTSRHKASHKEQVNTYRRLVAEIDRTTVQAYLWYPLLRRVVKV